MGAARFQLLTCTAVFHWREGPWHAWPVILALHRSCNSSVDSISQRPKRRVLRLTHLKAFAPFFTQNLTAHAAKSPSSQKWKRSYLQFSSGIEFLQAVNSLLSVHHGSNSRTLLEEEKNKLNWGCLKDIHSLTSSNFYQWCLHPSDRLTSTQLQEFPNNEFCQDYL